MTGPILRHLRHHIRFYLSALAGAIVWPALVGVPPGLRTVAAGNAFFVSYLASVAFLIAGSTPDQLRRRAASEDEGITVIIVITVFAVVVSFYSIFALLGYSRSPGAWHLALAILGVPLGWLTFHTVMAFHYAHLYYGQVQRKGDPRRDAGGLIFPGDELPVAVDFLYYSFVVAMTAQVSDVQVCSSGMRRVTLGHGIISFFFNAVILALAVNAAAELTR
ncbi:MAG: DUF1345 domain-containing protein [Gemmatimonas sp.]